MKEAAGVTKQALESGNLSVFGDLLHNHWMRKRERSRGMTNDRIDLWYEAGRRSGAVGGKLVGAGGGGFLMFLADDPARVRRAMTEQGLSEVRFTFDHDGSSLIVRA